jgi:PBP1b-binding outer membrane lipoprotein LpoB
MKQSLNLLLLILLLVGCSANAATVNNEKNTVVNTKAEEALIETKKSEKQETNQKYQPNPQVTDDQSLLTVGQTYSDSKGEATLKAINQVNQTYKMGPIELTVKEMKMIHLRPDYSMIDYFHVLTHDEEFDFVKLFVEIKNTSSEKVNFAPIALLKTSSGETFDWEKDIYLEELNGEIAGNSTKSGNLGFIVNASESGTHNDGDAKNIEWIEITTSDVFGKEEKKINESEKIKIEF